MATRARKRGGNKGTAESRWLDAVKAGAIALKKRRALADLIAFLGEMLEEAQAPGAPVGDEARAALHNELGLAHMQAGQLEGAEAHFSQALVLAPHAVNAAFNKGGLLMARKKAKEALALFSQVTELDPAHVGAIYHAGLCHLMLEEPGWAERATACFRRTAELDPDSMGGNYWAGEMLLRQQDYAQARPYFARTAELQPDNDCALRGLAICRLRAGEFRESLNLCERLLDMGPESQVFAWQIKGDAHLGLGEPAEAARAHAWLARQDYDSREYVACRVRELATADPETAAAYSKGIAALLPDMEPLFRAILVPGAAGGPDSEESASRVGSEARLC